MSFQESACRANVGRGCTLGGSHRRRAFASVEPRHIQLRPAGRALEFLLKVHSLSEAVMYTRRVCLTLLLVAAFAPAQEGTAAIRVTGTVQQPMTLTAADLAKTPRASVKATSNGVETTYEGVWVHKVLKRAGAPQGSALRGRALAGYTIARAEDGYQVVFSLAELDPSFIDHRILSPIRPMASLCRGRRGASASLFPATNQMPDRFVC